MINALLNDPDFQSVIHKYSVPNCFEIMGNTRREEWHSNFWCWLLNPNENHGLKTIPIKKFIEIMSEKSDKYKNINAEKLEDLTFTPEFKVTNGRVDILAENDEIVFVIENKVDSKENGENGQAQTDTYYNYFEETASYKNKQKFYIYLCRHDEKKGPKNIHFDRISHQELYDKIILECIELDYISSETKLVLDQYATAITGPETSLIYKNRTRVKLANMNKKLANAIYTRHEDTFKRIRTTMNDLNRDKDSEICKFYKKYHLFLNEILKALGIIIITPRTEKSPTGPDLLKCLVEDGIVDVNKTELYQERLKGAIQYIINIVEFNDSYKCYANCVIDGIEYEVVDENNEREYFTSISSAATEAEKEAYKVKNIPEPKGAGFSASLFIIRNALNKEYENKPISSVYASQN